MKILIKELKYLRKELLIMNQISCYRLLMDFFNSPIDNNIGKILEKTPTVLKDTVNKILIELIDMYEENLKKYKEQILYGQYMIWGHILNSYEELLELKAKLIHSNVHYYDDNYLKSCKEVERILSFYSQSQKVMSMFEDILGVDRYLDNLCSEDIEPLVALTNDIKKILEDKSKHFKRLFTKKWNTCAVRKIIEHQLIRYDGENEICTLFESNKKNVVLFVIDGFGYSQYQWHKNLNSDKITYTFNENIFLWLEKVNCINEFVLGTSYITDTAAGLANIFIGQPSHKTGIISSKLGKKNKSGFIETKKLSINDFENYFDTTSCSISELVRIFEVKSKLYYGSRLNSSNLGFSNYIFHGADIKQIIPSERMFTVLKDELNCKSGIRTLKVVYITGLDNTSHTMGAYSKFEKFEHEKFNMLLRNFLVEIATDRPELFNNETSFIFTADHGMAESSKVMINRYDIINNLENANININKVIENNRSLLLYGISNDNLERATICLSNYFEEINIDVDIIKRGDHDLEQFFCTNEENKISELTPDIIIRLISNGLFYSKESSEHLLHYAGHGGGSFGEQFVPLLQVDLDDILLDNLRKRFINNL